MGIALVLLGLLAFVVSVVCIVWPIRAIGIPTRKRAALLLVASFIVFVTGGVLLPKVDHSVSGLPDVAASQAEGPALKPLPPLPVAQVPATTASTSMPLPAPVTSAPNRTAPVSPRGGTMPESIAPPETVAPQPVSQVDPDDYMEACGGGKFDFCKGKTVVWDAEVQKIVDKWTVQARVTDKLQMQLVFREPINPDVLDAGIRFRFAGVIASQGGVFSWETVKKAALLETFNTKADLRAEHEAKVQADATRKLEEEAAAATKMQVDLDTYRLGVSKEADAHTSCQLATEKLAQYGARSDWLLNYSWGIKGKDIFIRGRDLRMKNGFNAERYVVYDCAHNVDTGETKVISVN
jgi:hypothetical protein